MNPKNLYAEKRGHPQGDDMTKPKTNDCPTSVYQRKYVYDAIETIQSGEWAPPHDMLLWQAVDLLLEERDTPHTLLS